MHANVALNVEHFSPESVQSEESEMGGLEHLKRLFVQLPVDNFNVLKYMRYQRSTSIEAFIDR